MKSAGRSTAALVALACGAFVIGTAEFVVVGVLDLVARDLGLSISAAGRMVSAYALGISLGAPLLAAATARFERRALLITAVVAFALANITMIVTAAVPWLLAARFLGGSIHGLYIGIASVMASQLVGRDQQGRALAAIFGGIAVATVLGVPIGTLIAQSTGWRTAFVALAVLASLSAAAFTITVPCTPMSSASTAGAQERYAPSIPVLTMLAVGFLLLGGQFSAFTYLVPFLRNVTGVEAETVSVYLLIYGVACALGAFIGGRFADKSASATLISASIVLLPTLMCMLLFGARPMVVAIVLFVWGLAGFGLVPALQLRVITLARGARDFAATLSASAVNAGIAAGSLTGGYALTRFGMDSIFLLAIVLCALAVPLAAFASRFSAEASSSTPDSSTLSTVSNRSTPA